MQSIKEYSCSLFHICQNRNNFQYRAITSLFLLIFFHVYDHVIAFGCNISLMFTRVAAMFPRQKSKVFCSRLGPLRLDPVPLSPSVRIPFSSFLFPTMIVSSDSKQGFFPPFQDRNVRWLTFRNWLSLEIAVQ